MRSGPGPARGHRRKRRLPEPAGKSWAIARGYEGDLVLLAGNPLENMENSRKIVAVLAD